MQPTGPYRILAVDDDVLALNLVQRIFEDDPDVRTLVTTSPKEALEIARKEPLDLVIADQRMAEMTGLELLQRLRVLQPDVIRILLTAYPDLQASLQAINEGLVYRFVLKPWNVDEMRITVRRAIESRRVQLENERLSAQLRQQFDELVQAERMALLGRLSAGVGHELGNAVMPLLLHLTLLSKRTAELFERAHCDDADPLSGKIKHSLDAMRKAGKQVMAVVSGLKGYAHTAPEPEPFNVNEAVRTAQQLLAHRVTEQVRLETQLGQVPDVVCRGEEIVQVVLNLVGNALDEIKEKGQGMVRVRTDPAREHVLITVADDGRGLAERVKENLFAPFISTKPAGIGTGLGLSICKSIVDAHGGRIDVDTGSKGTTFRVALPLVPPPKSEAANVDV